jgi:hypothetical protein
LQWIGGTCCGENPCPGQYVRFIGLVTQSASVISRSELLLMQKKKLFHSPTANHYNLRWTLGWFALMKLILFVVCAYSYKTMVVEIGPKGRGLVNARSLDDVILL